MRIIWQSFQSTPSAWRETGLVPYQIAEQLVFQSTPSAWRETKKGGTVIGWIDISIHSLRMEGDNLRNCLDDTHEHFNPLPPHGGRLWDEMPSVAGRTFQSTPSAWRETEHLLRRNRQLLISIHSLRMEGDCVLVVIYKLMLHFNPLPPHGGRQHNCGNTSRGYFDFNPLPPHGGRLRLYTSWVAR